MRPKTNKFNNNYNNNVAAAATAVDVLVTKQQQQHLVVGARPADNSDKQTNNITKVFPRASQPEGKPKNYMDSSMQ